MHQVVLTSLLLFLIGASCCLTVESSQGTEAPSRAESKATASTPEATLRRMHQYLVSAKDLDVTSSFSSVDQALGTSTSGSVHYILRKPNLLRVTASLKRGKVIVISDGKLLTIHETAARQYRRSPAPEDTLAGLYRAAGVLGMPTRMFDFFWSIDYLADIDEPAKLTKLNSQKIGGKTCDGFNIKYSDDNWSVWLDRSETPLPCRLESRRKDSSALTVQTNTFVWNVPPAIDARTFQFTAPAGHKEIGLGERSGPSN
jgi:hypothetical protein